MNFFCGCTAVDFQMPPICSPLVRPGRPVEAASVISEQLSNVLTSSELVNLSELCIAPGKAAWMAYLVCSYASSQSINFIVIE
jgi:exosome complex component RRP43